MATSVFCSPDTSCTDKKKSGNGHSPSHSYAILEHTAHTCNAPMMSRTEAKP